MTQEQLDAARAAPLRTWILDLDGTLFDAGRHVFPFLHASMNAWIRDRLGLDEHAAATLRRRYWLEYGATLDGLVRHHGIDPAEFLRATHALPDPRRMLPHTPGLRDALQRLPGRKVVFTNAPLAYAERVLRHLGLRPFLSAVYSIEHAAYRGKPDIRAFRALLADLRADPRRCVMVEDQARNLRPAKRLRMATALVIRGRALRHAHVDHRASSVTDLLRHV